jgi:hypothetical protein
MMLAFSWSDFGTIGELLLGLFKFLSWALLHYSTYLTVTGGAGLIVLLVNVGPLKRVNADGYFGKVAVTLCAFLIVVGVGWRIFDGVMEGRTEQKQTVYPSQHPTPAQRGVKPWDVSPPSN